MPVETMPGTRNTLLAYIYNNGRSTSSNSGSAVVPNSKVVIGKDRGNRLIKLGAIGLAAVGAVSAVAWAVCNATVVKSLPNSIVSYVAEKHGIPVEEGYFKGQVDSQNQPLKGKLTYSDYPCHFDGQFVEGVASLGEMRCLKTTFRNYTWSLDGDGNEYLALRHKIIGWVVHIKDDYIKEDE